MSNWFSFATAIGRLALDIWEKTANGDTDKARDVLAILDLLDAAGADISEFQAIRKQAASEEREISAEELRQLVSAMNVDVKRVLDKTPEDVRRAYS